MYLVYYPLIYGLQIFSPVQRAAFSFCWWFLKALFFFFFKALLIFNCPASFPSWNETC